jgi:hypothetical protein
MHGYGTVLFEDLREFGIKVSTFLLGFVDNDLGNSRGPVDYVKDGFIKNEDVSALLQYCLSVPPSACVTHALINSYIEPFPSTNRLALSLTAKL